MERSNTERVLTHRHNTENNLLSQISNKIEDKNFRKK